MRPPQRSVIAHHLIFTGYAHWLPNDPRGSGSTELRQEKLDDLGAIHHGRKRVQPPRSELRQFFREAEPRLNHPLIWFDAAKRQALAQSLAQIIRSERYTVYAAAILSNHMHLCIRRHRDSGELLWQKIAHQTAMQLRNTRDIPEDHPFWSSRLYDVYLYSPQDIRTRIEYIQRNPLKEGLPAQHHDFVTPYDNWPFHKKLRTPL